jgi:hypothetical protein
MTTDLPDDVRAMGELAALFATLEEDDVQRVLRWANEKYRTRTSTAGSSGGFGVSAPPQTSLESEPQIFADLPALMDATKPTNGLERILVSAYYNQIVKGEGDFDSQSVNTQLKHLGYPSANITRDMVRLVDRTPKLVIQTRKEGSTQQARKRFRLTVEGIKTVDAMLKKNQAAE